MNFLKIFKVGDLIVEYLSLGDMLFCTNVNKEFNKFFQPYIAERRKNIYPSYASYASENNDLSLIKYIHNLKPLSVLTSKFCIFYSCRNGHLDFAKWVHGNLDGDIDINKDHHTFSYTCAGGHLLVAKWLYSLGNVDIHEMDDYVFRAGCAFGHLLVAKWLYSLGGIKIDACHNMAFIESCEGGHLDVAQWLCTVNPKYSIELIDGKIKPNHKKFRY